MKATRSRWCDRAVQPSGNGRTALSFCFYAIPDGKPLRTFPGIALTLLRPGSAPPEAPGSPVAG
ncbi:hypothetical protein EFR84_18745 [Rhizobium chutanense]|uniref:Uncharacterized protein n=1 Tax=Rhizobium chutanense TaxID=2035448 RepID=A0A432NVS2_9HYPH|nr:hypothetical protein EFR84_18745 [Rhizobium chutanense]